MSSPARAWFRWEYAVMALLVIYPLLRWGEGRSLDDWLGSTTGIYLGARLTEIFVYAILALGVNVVVGYTGLLHLGIAAFFGIGAYIAAILTVPAYPFQTGFVVAAVAATLGTALMGVVLGAPTLRLRGDYLAIVTLGFGEVVRFALRNLEEITAGTRGLNPLPSPQPPAWFNSLLVAARFDPDWSADYRLFYFLALGLMLVVVLMLVNLEHSRIGRQWVAIREDELAASCMGINVARAKLASFALSAALAGLAGCLFATVQTTTEPEKYSFNYSITMLCCVILGGLGSLRGTLLGVFLLIGFDSIFVPWLDSAIQNFDLNASGNRLLAFSNWKFMMYGLALILMMRYRPEGLLPSTRVKRELHSQQQIADSS